jgi:hypothetical protein
MKTILIFAIIALTLIAIDDLAGRRTTTKEQQEN